MFKHTPVRRLYQPRIEQCWDCGDRKAVIAYQAKSFHGQTHYRWLCQECGEPRCIFPSLVLLARLQAPKKSSGGIVRISLKVGEYN
ncbi:MAG: hypothetical protein HC768_19395 [Acaryochloris sp. CRU_2_0]|nr:hypothetical protein [Acaryochloris sp. CRU_2_0]